MMNPVVHFELPYKKAERISRFYRNVFGWKITPLGSAFNDYIQAKTAETDAKPDDPAGSINGGFFPLRSDMPHHHPAIVIGVGNLQDSMKLVMEYGGEVLGEPMEISGFGLYVAFRDTEGNRNSMIQPTGM